MEIFLCIILFVLLYIIITEAINRSLTTTLLKENLKVLTEIRELLKNKNLNN